MIDIPEMPHSQHEHSQLTAQSEQVDSEACPVSAKVPKGIVHLVAVQGAYRPYLAVCGAPHTATVDPATRCRDAVPPQQTSQRPRLSTKGGAAVLSGPAPGD